MNPRRTPSSPSSLPWGRIRRPPLLHQATWGLAVIALLLAACGSPEPAPALDADADASGSPADASQGDADSLDLDVPEDGTDAADAADADVGPACPGPAGCPCTSAADCVAAPCTSATCTAGVCTSWPLDGAPCDADGNACTVGDKCQQGVCVPGAAKSCDDANPCTADACLPASGCTQTADDGVPCDDDNACTIGDTCLGGACAMGQTKSCKGSDPCVVGACHPSDGKCKWTLLIGGETCDDGSACTLAGECKGGACQPGAAVDCQDGNPCTDDACAPDKGCLHTANTSPCEDGDPCTGPAACKAGACKAEALSCDDGDPCTGDMCVAGKGCAHTPHPNTTPCGTALWCMGGKCVPDGVCGDGKVNAPGEVCDDGNKVEGDGCTPTCNVEVPGGMVAVPAGPFWMGCNATLDGACSNGEKPQHLVELSAYAIDVHEVTPAQFASCVQAGACTEPSYGSVYCNWKVPGRENHPVNCVTWMEAHDYCKWAGKRLPSEAEWEKAARGGCEKHAGEDCAKAMPTYPWGEAEVSCEYAVVNEGGSGCGTNGTFLVGSKPKGMSPYGVHDMAGNIWEWTQDWYDPGYYAASPTKDPPGPSSGVVKILRGGAFGIFGPFARSSFRATIDPVLDGIFYGFRCAK